MGFGPSRTHETGELRALELLARAWGHQPLTVFDVGANAGQWAREAAQILQLGAIHCFEPSPRAVAELRRNVRHSALRVHNFALGDRDGEASLFSDEPGSQLSSLYKRRLDHHGHHFEEEATVPIKRLDSFCAEAGIRRVDLLKLDTEGGELAVLRGAGRMLTEGSIEAIQFEFGTTPEARILFQDFFLLLDPKYRILRIISHGLLPITSYREHHEVFLAANYLCISRASTALNEIA
jgi:FkbM family methyltransferase